MNRVQTSISLFRSKTIAYSGLHNDHGLRCRSASESLFVDQKPMSLSRRSGPETLARARCTAIADRWKDCGFEAYPHHLQGMPRP